MKQLEHKHTVVRKPRIRLSETEAEFVLDVEMPGISESDVDLTVERNTLTLEASTDAMKEVRYARLFQLPKTIDSQKLVARMSNGILTLTLPKAKELQPRTIKVLAS